MLICLSGRGIRQGLTISPSNFAMAKPGGTRWRFSRQHCQFRLPHSGYDGSPDPAPLAICVAVHISSPGCECRAWSGSVSGCSNGSDASKGFHLNDYMGYAEDPSGGLCAVLFEFWFVLVWFMNGQPWWQGPFTGLCRWSLYMGKMCVIWQLIRVFCQSLCWLSIIPFETPSRVSHHGDAKCVGSFH
jgi:hypothetical protein